MIAGHQTFNTKHQTPNANTTHFQKNPHLPTPDRESLFFFFFFFFITLGLELTNTKVYEP